MMRNFVLDTLAGAFVGALIGLVLYACDARAQAGDETTLALAITYVAESGWDASRDHAAISHVLQRKAERHSLPIGMSSPRQVRWPLTVTRQVSDPKFGVQVELLTSAGNVIEIRVTPSGRFRIGTPKKVKR